MNIMLKKYIIVMLLLLPVAAKAQKMEAGLLGGIKSDGGWTGSAAFYLKLWQLQVGPVVEMHSTRGKYVFPTFATSTYTAILPGVNVNYIFPITRGYVYPGITARYRTGNDGLADYNGVDYGLQMGVVFKLVKSLSLNAETGFRSENTNVTHPSGSGKITNTYIPITVGLRFGF